MSVVRDIMLILAGAIVITGIVTGWEMWRPDQRVEDLGAFALGAAKGSLAGGGLAFWFLQSLRK